MRNPNHNVDRKQGNKKTFLEPILVCGGALVVVPGIFWLIGELADTSFNMVLVVAVTGAVMLLYALIRWALIKD